MFPTLPPLPIVFSILRFTHGHIVAFIAALSSLKARSQWLQKESPNPSEFEEDRLNRLLSDHLLRAGHVEVGKKLAVETGVDHLVDAPVYNFPTE